MGTSRMSMRWNREEVRGGRRKLHERLVRGRKLGYHCPEEQEVKVLRVGPGLVKQKVKVGVFFDMGKGFWELRGREQEARIRAGAGRQMVGV